MSTVTLTLTAQQVDYLAYLLANGINGYIFHDIPREETPTSILEAWRKERVLWKRDPFRGRGNTPRTKSNALESEADRKRVDFESRILARVIAAMPGTEGGAQ